MSKSTSSKVRKSQKKSSNKTKKKVIKCGVSLKGNKRTPRNIKLIPINRFGRLVTTGNLKRIISGKKTRLLVEANCDCGNIGFYDYYRIKIGRTKSCGCLRIDGQSARMKTHGMSNTKVFKNWLKMIERCTYEKGLQYKDYGGRGITVCRRWLKFENFLKDMGDRPEGKNSIDRIDNSKGYSKSNCRWANFTTQNRNKRNNFIIIHEGKKYHSWDLLPEFNIKSGTIKARLKDGWDIKKALTTKTNGKK